MFKVINHPYYLCDCSLQTQKDPIDKYYKGMFIYNNKIYCFFYNRLEEIFDTETNSIELCNGETAEINEETFSLLDIQKESLLKRLEEIASDLSDKIGLDISLSDLETQEYLHSFLDEYYVQDEKGDRIYAGEFPTINDIPLNINEIYNVTIEDLSNDSGEIAAGILNYQSNEEIYKDFKFINVDLLINNKKDYHENLPTVRKYIKDKKIDYGVIYIDNNSKFKNDMIEYFIKYKTIPLLEYGFYPEGLNSNINTKVLWDLLNTPQELLSKGQISENNIISQILFDSDKWIYEKLSALKKKGQKSVDFSTHLKLLSSGLKRQLNYPSGRPKTNMTSILEQKYKKNINLESPIYQIDKRVPEIILHPTSKGMRYFLPITRYGEGMSRGSYYAQNTAKKVYCGTFYYLEPDSNYLLDMGYLMNFRIYRSKLEAALKFYKILKFSPELPVHWLTELSLEIQYIFKSLKEYINIQNVPYDENMATDLELKFLEKYGSLLKPLPKPIVEVYDEPNVRLAKMLDIIYIFKGLNPPYGENINVNTFQRKINGKMVYESNFYAKEDRLDQILCKIGSLLQINVLIFTHMAGKYRVVGEALDTRSRDKSFNSIYKKN